MEVTKVAVVEEVEAAVAERMYLPQSTASGCHMHTSHYVITSDISAAHCLCICVEDAPTTEHNQILEGKPRFRGTKIQTKNWLVLSVF